MSKKKSKFGTTTTEVDLTGEDPIKSLNPKVKESEALTKKEAILHGLYVTKEEWGVWGIKRTSCPRCDKSNALVTILMDQRLRYGCDYCNFNGEYTE